MAEILKGIQLHQQQLLQQLDESGELNAKQLANAIGCELRNAYYILNGSRLLDLEEVNAILREGNLSPKSRESLINVALEKTGIIAVDLSGRDGEHRTVLADMTESLTMLAESIQAFVAGQHDGRVDEFDARAISQKISVCMADLAHARHTLATTTPKRTRARLNAA